MELSSSRSQSVSQQDLQMISSVRLATALVSAPTSVPIVSLPTPAEHLSRRDATVNAVPRSSGTLASLAEQSNKLSHSVNSRMGKCSSPHSSGKTLPLPHNIARVCSAKSRASRHALASAPKVDRMVRFEALLFQVMKDIGMASVLSPDRSEPPHRPTLHAGSGPRYPSALPLPSIHRRILLRPDRHRHCERLSLCTFVLVLSLFQ